MESPNAQTTNTAAPTPSDSRRILAFLFDNRLIPPNDADEMLRTLIARHPRLEALIASIIPDQIDVTDDEMEIDLTVMGEATAAAEPLSPGSPSTAPDPVMFMIFECPDGDQQQVMVRLCELYIPGADGTLKQPDELFATPKTSLVTTADADFVDKLRRALVAAATAEVGGER